MPSRLCLKNTLTGRKEIFKPRGNDRRVKMFTCGPSIYSWPHIGNYRTFLFEDLLQRYLAYLGYTVQRLINFTDVEDKAVDAARRTDDPRDEEALHDFRVALRRIRATLSAYSQRSASSRRLTSSTW